MTWLLDNLGLIGTLSLQHLRLSLVPILVGTLGAIPLGWIAWRFPFVRGGLLGAVGLVYTIPSLALFVLLPPILGIPFLSEWNVIIALTLYAVAILVRGATDAFSSVGQAVLDQATALGYSPWQRFWRVELPLAGPVILAGVRVVAVSTVALVTVGVLVGVSSLGYFFTDGFQRRIPSEIATGIIMTVAVALVLDLLIVRVGRLLLPWSNARRYGEVTT